MPGIRPYSADLDNSHAQVPLALGDALMIKASVASAGATVNLAVANGVVYAGAATSGTTLLQVGPFAADVVLNVMATGKVRVETSVAGLSAAV